MPSNVNITSAADLGGFNKFEQAVNRFDASMRKLEAAAQKATRSFKGSKRGLAQMTASMHVGFDRLATAALNVNRAIIRGITGSFSFAVDESLKFNRAMSEVSTLFRGDVTPAMDKMRITALKMAGEFGQMPTTVVQAFYETISAGAVNAASSMNVMRAAGELSVGGMVDMQTAARGIVSILSAFGKTSNDFAAAGDLADTFFVAMQKGITRIPLLVSQMGRVAGAAKVAGLSMQELFAATAAVTTKGLNTETAVVSMNNALKVFVKASKGGREAAARYGISLDKLKEGGFAQWLGRVGAMAKQNKQAFGDLFPNIRGQRAMIALLAEEVSKYTEIMGFMAIRQGASREAMEKVSKTMSFQIQQFEALRAALGVAIGDFITKSPAALGFMQGINQSISFLVHNITRMSNSVDAANADWAKLTREGLAKSLETMGAVLIAVGQSIVALDAWAQSIAWVVKNWKFFSEIILAVVSPSLNAFVKGARMVGLHLDDIFGRAPQVSTDLGKMGVGFIRFGEAVNKSAEDLRNFKVTSTGVTDEGFNAIIAREKQRREKLKQEIQKTRNAVAEGAGLTPNVKPEEELADKVSLKLTDVNAEVGLELERKKRIEQEKLLNEQLRARTQIIKQNANMAMRFVNPLTQGLTDIILEGQKLKDTVVAIGKSFIRMAVQWISKQLVMRAVTSATSGAYVASKASEASAEAAAAKVKIAAKAGSAAAGAAESTASIPIVGPLIAVGAALALLAFVQGLAGGFNQGGVIPGGGPNRDSTFAAVTPGERVLSRDQTESFDRLVTALERGNTGGGGSGGTLNLTVQMGGGSQGGGSSEDRAELEKWVEDRLAPMWFRLQRENRIGDQSLSNRRV